MNMPGLRTLVALSLVACTTPVWGDTAVGNGGSKTVSLAPNEINAEFYVDVPAGATKLFLTLEGGRPA